jgi:hypothetical protein
MLKLICAALFVTFASAAAGQQTKTDIRGLSPGMTEEQAKKVLPCTVSPVHFNECKFSEGTFRADFTRNLNPNLLAGIDYGFVSGTAPNEMIELVSREFNATPTNQRPSDQIVAALKSWRQIGRVNMRMVATWQLNDETFLALLFADPRNPAYSSGPPFDYSLKLVSQKVLADEQAAAQAAKDAAAAKARGVNPAPKF